MKAITCKDRVHSLYPHIIYQCNTQYMHCCMNETQIMIASFPDLAQLVVCSNSMAWAWERCHHFPGILATEYVRTNISRYIHVEGCVPNTYRYTDDGTHPVVSIPPSISCSEYTYKGCVHTLLCTAGYVPNISRYTH